MPDDTQRWQCPNCGAEAVAPVETVPVPMCVECPGGPYRMERVSDETPPQEP